MERCSCNGFSSCSLWSDQSDIHPRGANSAGSLKEKNMHIKIYYFIAILASDILYIQNIHCDLKVWDW